MSDLETEQSNEKQVQVRFVTKIEALQALLPESSFSVPLRLARYGLSEIVNHLTTPGSPQPFDFLIDGQFLRTDLRKWFSKQGDDIGETGVVLEVVKALQAPDPDETLPHPDWVSSVATQENLILTGCYDGAVRVFDGEEEIVCTGHSAAIKAVRFLESAWCKSVGVSASKDNTVRVWKYENGQCTPAAIYTGHTNSVEALAVQGAKVCSGGWDGGILIWDVDELAEDLQAKEEADNRKRRKKVGTKGPEPVLREAPLQDMQGHDKCISAIAWPDPLAIYSGSWDQTIRLWDTTSATCTTTWNGPKPITSLDFSTLANLLCTGSNDSVVRLWDPRQAGREVVKLSLKSHASALGWVSAVAWCPTDAHLLCSASYDKTIKIWDTRSSMPLHTIRAHTDKLLCVAWQDGTVLSGGADCQLRKHTLGARREDGGENDGDGEETAVDTKSIG